MSHIDVHEIKLNLRYPNSRQEDITDAFMRGYQGAVKIGNDAVRRVKAEKAALERRIDELCAEVERLHADQAHWELGNCPSCPNIADLQEALEQNDKLRNILAHAVMLADLYEGLTDTRLSLDGGIVDCDWLRAWCKKLGIEVPS